MTVFEYVFSLYLLFGQQASDIALLVIMLAKDTVVPLLAFLRIGVHGRVF